MDEICADLLAVRVHAGISRPVLCEQADIALSALHAWERGYECPTTLSLIKWAGFFQRRAVLVGCDGEPVAAGPEPGPTGPWQRRELAGIIGALMGRRESRGLSRPELARAAGLPPSGPWYWETGRALPGGIALIRWAAGLDCDVELREVAAEELFGEAA